MADFLKGSIMVLAVNNIHLCSPLSILMGFAAEQVLFCVDCSGLGKWGEFIVKR